MEAQVQQTGSALQKLQRITDAALSHLELDDLLAELLDRLTEVLGADTAAVLLLSEDGKVLEARAAKGIEEEVERGVRIPVGKGFAGRVAAERRPVVIEDVDHADILNPILREKGLKSLLGVPLLVEAQVIGVLHVGSLTTRVFSEEEIELLQLAADRAALAIDHARLYHAEVRAREAAEATARLISRLQRITDAALAHLGLDDLLAELLDRLTEMLGVDTAAVLLLSEDGKVLEARAAKGIEEEVERGVRIPVGKGFAGRIAAERRPVVIEDIDHADILNPILREKGLKSLLGVPLLVEAQVIGVLHVGSLAPRVFSEEEVELLQLAADRVALAISAASRYEREHEIVETLQKTLLPSTLPELPGLAVAARYTAAGAAAQLGGDWYDAFQLADGRVGVVMGDVVGHGVEAAALMGQLRNGVRVYALNGDPPAGVAAGLNRLLRELERGRSATLLYAVVDPDNDSVRLATAGHPPPLLLSPDRTGALLELPASPPLGVTPRPVYEETELEFGTGSTLLAYTDGLVERRGEDLDDGLARLQREARHAPEDPQALCDTLTERLLGAGGTADDAAVLAIRRTPLPERLSLLLPAEVESAMLFRRVVARWLRQIGANCIEADEIKLACSEACANAIEHAYSPARARFQVEAEMAGDDVVVRIRDWGQWRAPRGEFRGRGLLLMNGLMDEVHIERASHGSTVTLRRTLRREAAA